ncbi:MAG: hypothetical protein HC813_01800 [Planctomycetes bacterium]|nr:hypothetical protein [Planctomycetota bacterium]
MRKARKILLIVLALLILVALSIPLWVDHAAKVAVESGGSSALGVPTHLGEVSLGLFGGTCELGNLRIDNPEG